MEDITIEELKSNDVVRGLIINYRGDNDPVAKLNEKVSELTKDLRYYEFIDMNMDNPWVRVIVFGDL
jgi:ABC-type uncharacterized transport system substrate-binding protein